jgi:hypothetical protein
LGYNPEKTIETETSTNMTGTALKKIDAKNGECFWFLGKLIATISG